MTKVDITKTPSGQHDYGDRSNERKRVRNLKKVYGRSFCFVYALVDVHGTIRYVGQTRSPLFVRFGFHMKEAHKYPHKKLSSWLLEYDRDIVMLDDNGTWNVSEILWIDKLRREGADLLNILRGGNDSIHALERTLA
jgi:hypothetical protein